jgi:hypothetical protein
MAPVVLSGNCAKPQMVYRLLPPLRHSPYGMTGSLAQHLYGWISTHHRGRPKYSLVLKDPCSCPGAVFWSCRRAPSTSKPNSQIIARYRHLVKSIAGFLDLLICVVLYRSGHLFRVKAGTFFDCSIGHSSNPCSKLCGPLPATTPDSTQTTAWRFHRNAKRENPRSVTASEARDASEVVAARIVTSTGDLHPSLVPLGHICFFSFCNDAMVSPVWAGVNPGCRSCCDRSAVEDMHQLFLACPVL